MYFIRTSIKSLAGLALAATLSMLGGCGGGGATDPFAATPAAPALVVAPTTLNIYAGTPAVVTITSGTGPFRVFSSDAVVLPVTQVVGGAAITLVGSPVTADTAVTLTINDAVGKSTQVAVTVKPSPLIGGLNIVPTTNTTCSGTASSVSDKAAVCSGESALVTTTLRSAATSPIANRQVRFDVIQGAYNFAIDQSASTLAKTYTVLTDQNGKADAVIRTNAAAPSQIGLVRATDVVSGNRVDSAFTIVQAINGSAVLSVVPSDGYSASGFYKNECPSTSGDFVIYGGTAPYTARSALPGAVTLSVNGVISDPVTVTQAGNTFRASTSYSAGCSDYKSTISVVDATGRLTTVTYEVKAGTNDRPALPDLVLSPKSVTLAVNSVGKCSSRTVSFIVVGGSGSGVFSASAGTMVNNVWSSDSNMSSGDTATVTFVDSSAGKLITADITCK